MKIRYFSDEHNGVELCKIGDTLLISKTKQGVETITTYDPKEVQAIKDFLAIEDF